jgi:hypothetical protein
MNINPSLAIDLAILSNAVDDPSTDVGQSMRQMGADVKRAVDSYVGLSVTVEDGGHP